MIDLINVFAKHIYENGVGAGTYSLLALAVRHERSLALILRPGLDPTKLHSLLEPAYPIVFGLSLRSGHRIPRLAPLVHGRCWSWVVGVTCSPSQFASLDSAVLTLDRSISIFNRFFEFF